MTTFGQWQQLRDGTWELHTTDGRELVAEVEASTTGYTGRAYGPCDVDPDDEVGFYLPEMRVGSTDPGEAGRLRVEKVARQLWGLA